MEPISESTTSRERIDRLYHEYWVNYSRAEEAIHKLEDLFQRPRRLRMPNVLIISPTNNGKTMIVEKFRRQHLSYPSQDKRHQIIPVVMIQMPSEPNIKRFYALIMGALGSPVTTYTSVASYETMALKLLSTVQTKILIIDEIHNILACSPQRQREFLNILRFLGNQLRLSIVAVGTKEAYLAIRSDDQLENRFEPLILPLWQDDQEFVRLLSSFQKLLPLQKPSDLLDGDIRKFILRQSEGTIGEIAMLLTQAACEAIHSGKECIDQVVLEQTNYQSPTQRRQLCESMLR